MRFLLATFRLRVVARLVWAGQIIVAPLAPSVRSALRTETQLATSTDRANAAIG